MTAEERQKAILHNQDIAKLGRLGTEQLSRVGANLYRAVMAAYRKGGTIAVAVEKEMKPVPEIIAKGMALAHIHGRYRGILNAKKAGATVLAFRRTSETYDKAVDWLRKRMEVSKKDLAALEELYHAQALNISKGLETWVDSKMERAAMDVVQQGMTTREGTRVMAEAMEAVGMVPHNSFTAEALFRTQTKLAYGAARWQENQEEWVQEILWGYKYVTVGDDRVRPTHEALEGMTAPKDDPIWNTIWPPNGWACRCDILDLFDEREIVKPDAATIAAGPDKGFDYNPGKMFLKEATQSPVAPVTTKPEIRIPEQPVEKPPEVVPEKPTEERPSWEPGKRTYATESEFRKARAQYAIKLEKEWRAGLADTERIAKEGAKIPAYPPRMFTEGNVPSATLDMVKRTEKTLQNIEAFMHPDVASIIQEKGISVYAQHPQTRASSSENDITVPEDCSDATLFHEIGHVIEKTIPELKKKCFLWRDSRRDPQKGTMLLSEVTGNSKYGKEERVVVDDFIDPYVGKVYPGGGTEVFSMGLQQFATPESLRLFAEKDFDHFSFIVGILKGEL